MSPHGKQNVIFIGAMFAFVLICLLSFLTLHGGGGQKLAKSSPSHTVVTTTEPEPTFSANNTIIKVTIPKIVDGETIGGHSSTNGYEQYPPRFDDLPTQYFNHSFIGDENWSGEDNDDIEDINNGFLEDTVDFVKLRKVHNVTLNADDLLYESKRNHSSTNKKDYFSAFSVTGTFRSKSSQIWDPHPEYIINTFGRQLHLVLHQDTSFIPPKTFRVIRILNNRTEEEDDEEEGHYLGCYYKGHVEGDEQSGVAVSLCNGMTGYIKTSFGSLLIQPVANQSSDEADILHKVWRHSRRNTRHAVSAEDLGLGLEMLEQNIFTKLLRTKRNNVDRHLFTMEVLVAVDHTMNDFHREDLKSYILTLISIVSNIFADASIGNSIYISVAHILILREDITTRVGRKKPTPASHLLKHFCAFAVKSNYHYDTAMLITRDQICRNAGETKCDTLGLAELGTVCKRQSCSIVQDNGLPAAFTIAHELGHILNMPHDDDDRCKQFNKPGTKRRMHIMSSIMGDDIHPWSWSDCSRYYVSEFLEKEEKLCLEDTPAVSLKNMNTKQPGEIYSLDHQCQLIHGNQSRFCYIEGECKRLWCKSDIHVSDCRSSNLPWADGTPCNEDRYWCQKGECIPREGNLRQLLNGGWGPWSHFTPCSLTCGGGVQESQRECNNPLPKNGGKYCAGSRKKYRSCNTHPCPTGALDSREQQCYDMNGRNFGIKGIDGTAKWIPKYGLSSKDKCKLYCRLEDNSAYFRLSEKVKDGTTCSFDSFDKCVNGICRPAGCDNELNSIAKLDKCGVCEGRNDTCEEFTGNFYVSDLFKIQPKSTSYYYYVTTIPKGASNIVITQPGYHNENYIVLRDDHRNSLLNGNKLISMFSNVSIYAGVTFEYNGSNSTVERVNTTFSRKLKRDLIVEVISLSTNAAKNNDSLLLTYSYTMDKQNYYELTEVEIYRWEMQQWSDCDALCQGNAHRSPVCVSTTKALKVAPQFCDEAAQPPTEYQKCNLDCTLMLNVTSISECSAACGLWGIREKTFLCTQTFPEKAQSDTRIVDLAYCAAKFEITRHEQCREGCWDYTEWSQCSKSCDTGTQTRSIACFLNQTRLPDTSCNPKKKVIESTLRTCNTDPCHNNQENTKISRSIINNWWTSEWGECDEHCGKNRTVVCRNPLAYGCPSDKKPISKRKCCKIKYVTSWSNCPVECGEGVRVRKINCARVYQPDHKGADRKRIIIDPSHCRQLSEPKLKRTWKSCKVSCKWSTSDWTQCPADCKDEYQSRSVYCENVHGNPIAYGYCEKSKKPPAKKICNNCVFRKSRSISKCGCDGTRLLRVFCYDSLRRPIVCPTKEKIRKEKCEPPRDCLPQSCADVQRIHSFYHDQEYTIHIRTRPTKIYCYNMNTSKPREYITLNPTENYSIFYDYKTEDPDKCPPESRHLEFRDNNTNSGRTTFQKIGLNISQLRLIENDFTFATTNGAPQSYGSAGDCYNRNMECPQGDFSINLEHTGFILRPGTTWERSGSNMVMKMSSSFNTSRTSRRAFCGGYCGRCRISPRSGLYIDVV